MGKKKENLSEPEDDKSVRKIIHTQKKKKTTFGMQLDSSLVL